jgi:hypothetical protein
LRAFAPQHSFSCSRVHVFSSCHEASFLPFAVAGGVNAAV